MTAKKAIKKRQDKHNSSKVKSIKKVQSKSNHKNNNPPKKSIFQKFLKIEHDLPLGMRVMTVYLFLLAFFYLITGLYVKKAMIFGLFIEGPLAFLINLITILLILLMVYGIAKKDLRHYYLTLIFFVLIILNTLISIFAVRSILVGAFRNFINLAFFLTLALNIITLVFLMSKKYYFEHPKPEYHVHGTDKVFVIALVVIWASLLIGTLFYGDKYFDESFSQVDRLIFDLEDRGVIESLYYCESNNNPDLCYYIAAQMNKEDLNSKKLCESIHFPFFYTDCIKRIQITT